MQPYRGSYLNSVTKKRIYLRIDMSINFQAPVHFLHSKGVKRLKWKISGNKLIAAACLSMEHFCTNVADDVRNEERDLIVNI